VRIRHGSTIASAPALPPRAMRRSLFLILAVLALLAPATALAGSSDQLYRDCQDGKIDGKYTQSQYQQALANIPADLDEYTDCRQVIRQGQLQAAGGKSGGGHSTGGGSTGAGGGGSSNGGGTQGGVRVDPLANATPQERKALAKAGVDGGKPVKVAGQLVTPGALGFRNLSSGGSELPTPLLVVLALIAAGMLGYGATTLWSRVNARRTG
jgi:hypothetical protein